jgi:ACS family D-galactonate transporter-like MFS transporter
MIGEGKRETTGDGPGCLAAVASVSEGLGTTAALWVGRPAARSALRERAADPLAASTNVRWRIFLLMLMLIAINYVDRASISVAMPVISREFNIGLTAQGAILSSFFLTYAVMQIPGGMLADRFKPRAVIAVATLGWGFFQAIAALSVNVWVLALTRLGLGAFEAPIYPAGGKLNAIWMTANERARGATLLDGGVPLGAALGSLIIAGLIAEFDSWRVSFIVTGAGTMLCGLLAWRYIRDNPADHPSVNAAEADLIATAHAREDSLTPTSAGTGVKAYFRHPSVWFMCCGWMSFNAVFYGLLTWMPNYLATVHGLDIKQLGGSLFSMFFSGFVGEMVGGQIADRWRARGGRPNVVFRTLFGVAAIVAALSILSVAYVRDPVLVVLLLSSALFFLRWCGMYWAIPSLLASRARAGLLGGCMNFAGNIAGVAVPTIVGFLVQSTGSYFLALMFFAAAAVALLVCSALIDYSRKVPV